jgi:hypothetical protein
MTFSYSLVVVDEDANVVIAQELTPDAAVKILADVLAARAAQSPKPLTIRDRQKELEATEPVSRKHRVCSICGKPGHDVRKCPDGKRQHLDGPAAKNRSRGNGEVRDGSAASADSPKVKR